MTINDALVLAQEKGVEHFDAQLIIAHLLDRDRTHVVAHPEEELSTEQEEQLIDSLDQRANNTPVAYITGTKEFFGRSFHVSGDTMIPRPESELLIEWLLKKLPKDHSARILDMGTGTGCLATTLACELPNAKVVAVDISNKALKVAKKNAAQYQVTDRVSFVPSNLLEKPPTEKLDAVIANLPYLDAAWDKDPSTQKEPSLALYADHGGLALYETFLHQLPGTLNESAIGALEADPRNTSALLDMTKKILPNKNVQLHTDLAGRRRFVTFE